MGWVARAVTVVLVLCLAALGIIAYEISRPERSAGEVPPTANEAAMSGAFGQFTALAAPRPAPAVRFTTLAGAPETLADFRGHVVLLNLWATWCGPCLKEMPSLQRLQRALGPRLTIIALSQDRRGAAAVKPFLARYKLDALAVYLDPDDRASQAFGVSGLPTSFLIDRDGRILGSLEGAAQWDGPTLRTLVAGYLKPVAAAAP